MCSPAVESIIHRNREVVGLILIGAGFFLFHLSNFPLILIGSELTLPKVNSGEESKLEKIQSLDHLFS